MIAICFALSSVLTISDRKEKVSFSIPLLAIQTGVKILKYFFICLHICLVYLADVTKTTKSVLSKAFFKSEVTSIASGINTSVIGFKSCFSKKCFSSSWFSVHIFT